MNIESEEMTDISLDGRCVGTLWDPCLVSTQDIVLLLLCLPQPEHEWNSLCHNFFNPSCLAQEQTKSQFKKIVNFVF